MYESIYYSKKKKPFTMPPIDKELIVNREVLEDRFNIIEETEKSVLAIAGIFTLVFIPQKNNLYKVETIN